MDCREFRNKHVAFVDDLLPAVDMDAMQQHLTVCSRCSRQDTTIRRSLMLVRSLPSVEPSPDFFVRLNARLEELGPITRADLTARPPLPSLGAFAALAAGIAAIAYMSIETTRYFTPEPALRSSPAVASVFEPAPIPNAAFVASVPTGMPVWPAVLMVGQAPLHFASMEFREDDATR